MKFKHGQRVGIITENGIAFGNVEKDNREYWGDIGASVEIRFGNCTAISFVKCVLPVWEGEAFGRKQFNSLSGCLHSVGLRNLELSSRRMLEPLNGCGVFCFCVELKEVLENGIFRKDPYCEMVVKNFLDWAAHGFPVEGGA